MRKRGFVLLMSLLLVVLLLVVGLAFLGQKALQYRSAGQAQLAAQAKALAEAGLEDFRIKLQRDLNFPPHTLDQALSAYSEQVSSVGSYTVTVNATYQMQPYAVLVVTSLGEVGNTARNAVSRRALRVEVDLARFLRSDPSVANPNYRRITSYQDLGGL